jgi:hypothetical protein
MLFFSVPFIFYLRSLLMWFDLTRTRQGAFVLPRSF